MKRAKTPVVSLFLPRWPRIASEGNRATHRRRLITALYANAERRGVRIGRDITKAKTLAPNLIIGDNDPAAETEGLTKLALWALQRIFPVVTGDRPDGLVIDTTGADQLHRDASAALCATKHLEPQLVL